MNGATDGVETLPSLIRTHSAALVDPPGFWSVLATIAWVGSRDVRLVAAVEVHQNVWDQPEFRRVTARELWEIDLPENLRHYCSCKQQHRCFAAAVRDFMGRLQEGRLDASGVRDGQDRREEIGSLEFADAAPVYDDRDGFRLLPDVGKVRFRRAQVMERWPLAPGGAVVALVRRQERKAGHRGRARGVGGLARHDGPLVEKMRQLLEGGDATSPSAAANLVLDLAKGASDDAKRRRLVGRYYEKYGGDD